MIKTFCDRCGKETTGDKHGSINGVEDADDEGNGTNQAPDCFDIVCGDCFQAWRLWMKRCLSPAAARDAEVMVSGPTVEDSELVSWSDTREKS